MRGRVVFSRQGTSVTRHSSHALRNCGGRRKRTKKEIGMATGKKDSSLASKQLKDKKSTPAEKSVAGSDLSQSKKKKK